MRHICVFLGLLLLVSCAPRLVILNEYYATDGSNLYYNSIGNSSGEYVVVDKMFSSIESTKPPAGGHPDIGSLEVVNGEFIKDKNDVYYPGYVSGPHGEDPETVWLPLGADPGTFEMLNEQFSRDREHLYFLRRYGTRSNQLVISVSDADLATFELNSSPLVDEFGNRFMSVAKDKNRWYYTYDAPMCELLQWQDRNETS